MIIHTYTLPQAVKSIAICGHPWVEEESYNYLWTPAVGVTEVQNVGDVHYAADIRCASCEERLPLAILAMTELE